MHQLQRQDTGECQDGLCGEPLGSQQTLLMGCVLDCHPLPLKLGTPAAPGHPAMPRVLSCWGNLGCFPNGATSQLKGKPPAEQSISSSWDPHWLLRGLHAGQTLSDSKSKLQAVPMSLDHELTHEVMQTIFTPEGAGLCGVMKRSVDIE